MSVLESPHNDTELSNASLIQLLEVYDKLDQPKLEAIPANHRAEIQETRIKATALFEWSDGNLVHAMKTGQFFLLDEISLADDSVLERLNSVLESSRTLLLAEKGPNDSLVTAEDGFQFLATMNPGGDYGKKELSPALRNRFTEIWVPALSDVEDILQIVRSKLKPSALQYAESIVSFAQWFNEEYNTSASSSISIRDTLAWVTFVNNTQNDDPLFGIVHGAAMVFIDTLGANPAGLLAISSTSIEEERKACLHRLGKLVGKDVTTLYFDAVSINSTATSLQIGSFSIPKNLFAAEDSTFSFEAPTTRSNAMRVVRALQLPKPILLEGNPGVGKTTLIIAIGKAIGMPLTRLNLSDQTDLMDLFGSDVPVEGGQAGTFAWRDAPFLKAMKNGEWVLLDEMNLASQSVLEGLNAVLDHRGEVYISELDQIFHKHPDFRVFAAQNPHHQGGGRKGLPASFVNRFTVVYADVFRPHDLSLICTKIFPHIDGNETQKLINFVASLDDHVVVRRSFGALGSPWEFNLRDTLRWLQLLHSQNFVGSARDLLDTIFMQRFRNGVDRQRLLKLFEDSYGSHEYRVSFYHNLCPKFLQVGLGLLARNSSTTRPDLVLPLRVTQLGPMESIMISVQQNWPVILVGPPGSGKTSLLSQLASFVGAELTTFSMNADIDAMDLVGGYEQEDPSREINRYLAKLEKFVRRGASIEQTPSLLFLKLLELLSSGQSAISGELYSLLETLAKESRGTTSLESQALLQELERLSQAPTHIEGARFRWADGILIQALEQGNWLVLDNANLCSSAVLDRLNSLLEPNGYLSINEHSTDDGEARIVRPHKDFRIFLTMDPRFGELSRAMRNRATEIFLLPKDYKNEHEMCYNYLPGYPLESQSYRFRNFMSGESGLVDTISVPFEHLIPMDREMLQTFNSEALKGLASLRSDSLTNRVAWCRPMSLRNGTTHTSSGLPTLSRFLTEQWHSTASYYQTQLTHDIGGPLGFDYSAYHPLVNELCLNADTSTRSLLILYAEAYDEYLDLYNMQHAIEMIPSMKFERRKEKQKLPAFLQAFRHSLIIASGMNVNPIDITHFHSFHTLRVLFWAFLQLAT
ncbi:P-loop containing nucleoside triphosphate hydrolase protein, partial [Lindgomyces ingoldianus]